MELGLRALRSEVAGDEKDESEEGANELNNSLSSQSTSSSRLMKDCESGSEVKEAVGSAKEERTLDERTAVGGAVLLLAVEAEGGCSISRLRNGGQTNIR